MVNFTPRLAAPLLVFCFIFFNVSQVHTKPGAPPAGGVSGDPSRSTCAFIGCHPGPELSFTAGELDLNMGTTSGSLSPMAGQTYVPGQTYYIKLKPNVTNGNNTSYGFQTTALDASGNMAGSFTITDATHNSAQNLLSRDYIGHKNANSFHDWNFTWTAPATNVGKVTFYYAIDDADNNGGTSGDKVYKGSTDIMAATGTGISEDPFTGSQVSLFPNPAQHNAVVTFNAIENTPVQLSIYSLVGKLIQTQTEEGIVSGKNTLNIDLLPEVCSGIYLLKISTGSNIVTTRFMVL